MTREDRAHELRELSRIGPQRLIALYRNATGKDELGQLPAGSSFASMIDAIIAHEVAAGKIQDEPPHGIR
jgi:hypothetical protein